MQEVEDEENPNSLSTQQRQELQGKTKVEEENSKDEVQPQIHFKVPVVQNDKHIQFSSPVTENTDDDESELLAVWYGNPEKDIMSAEDWLESVGNAKGEITQFWECLRRVYTSLSACIYRIALRFLRT